MYSNYKGKIKSNKFALTLHCEIVLQIMIDLTIYIQNISMLKWLLLMLVTISAFTQAKKYIQTSITDNWSMNILSGPTNIASIKQKNYPTSIPTTIHLVLQAAGDIPDPFIKQNYPTVKYLSDCNIRFSVNFTVDDAAFQFEHQELVFQGIDTYSDILLNGNKIISTQNAFVKYKVNVKQHLKKGANSLQVKIYSTNENDNAGQQANSMPFAYAQTRKACYQYSWDWAPYLNTLGIWKDVYLESYNEVKIDYVWLRTRAISKERATINFAVALDWNINQLTQNYQAKVIHNENQIAAFPIREKYSYYDVHIDSPQLWWPNGIGKPHIYDFTVRLVEIDTQTTVDEKKIPFGIRTVELDLKEKKFEVKVNGYSVYCKGANYVPLDMFYPRLTNKAYKPGNTIEDLLNAAADSHFNMIRVWGGGQYESDKFLELASRKGIMLFYDFMFSDSIYPSTQKFLINVEEQIKQQIRRARNYPALTLWSGNNQILQGINDWGWGRQNYREDYKRLFEILIPKIIEYESPYIPYIPSSPVYGVGNYGLERGGDTHFWSVWAGGAEFQSYITNVGRFNSEFGTQSLPLWETIIEAIDPNPSYQSSSMLLHERHNSRFGTLRNYMNSYMKSPINFQLQTYQSGLLQAYAIEVAIKAQRIAKPKSFGTLYWQFNDAWPGISWSSIDYYGRWKPLQFMAKRLYPDVAIYTLKDKVYAVNDKLYDVTALAIIKVVSFSGKILKKIQKAVDLKINQVKQIYQLSAQDYQGSPESEAVIYTEIVAGKNEIMSSTNFNVRFKDLNLPSAEITVEYNNEFNEMTIQTYGPIVKNLFISHSNIYIRTTNNYFDLVPGHPIKVVVLHPDGLQKLKSGLIFRSYRQVYTKDSSVKVNAK